MASSMLMHGETIIGEVMAVEESVFVHPDDHTLIVRLDKRAELVRALMKEDLVYFDILNVPAQQG